MQRDESGGRSRANGRRRRGGRARREVLGTALLAVAGALAVAPSCADDRPEVLRQTLDTGGPRVRYDATKKPFPEIPYPNDSATTLDDTSPTGRRLNIALEAPTEVERRVRRRLNTLDGFGVLAPVTVAFDAEPDLADLHARQNDDDPANDAILLVRLGPAIDQAPDPMAETYGAAGCGPAGLDSRRAALDVGGGHYPLVLDDPCLYLYRPWEGDFICDPAACEGDDPRKDSPTVVFETYDEDLDGDGVLDPGEDTDFDGRLDRANTWSGTNPGVDGPEAADDVITFFERETNTLIAWPVAPLEEASRYAVVLTKHLKDAQGRSIVSPFEGTSAANQARALRPLEGLLPCWGYTLDDVAFAWTFTTGTPTRVLHALRDGLYGEGPFAELGEQLRFDRLQPKPSRELAEGETDPPPDAYLLPTDVLLPIIQPLAGGILETPGAGQELTKDSAHVDYWVVGTFESANLLVDKDGRAIDGYPDDQDEVFDLELSADGTAGRVTWAPHDVPFICSIPKATEDFRPPFPVVLYNHGYSGATFEVLGFAGRFARAGFALCGVEAPGHGLVIPETEAWILDLVDEVLPTFGLTPFFDNYYGGRVRDLDLNGVIGERDNGTDFWSADVFHTRDAIRQMLLDQMVFVRTLRAIDGRAVGAIDTGGDGDPDLVGDWNGDGVPDLGGWVDVDGDGARGDDEPEPPYHVWGQSLGGISSALLSAVEPAFVASAPVSAAGGAVHVATRSTNLGVPDAVLLPIMGPFVTFRPAADDPEVTEVGFLVPRVNEPVRPIFHRTTSIQPGDRVVVRNDATGREVEAFVPADRRFRLGIASDAMRIGDRRQHLRIGEPGVTPPVSVTGDFAARMGDPLRVVVHEGWDGPVDEVVSEVTVPFEYMGARHEAGGPLVAPHEGLGYGRGTPNFRRLLGIAQTITEPGDPAAYAPTAWRRPRDYPYETEAVRARRSAGGLTSTAIYHSVGDSAVPIATGFTLARAFGILDPTDVDPDSGKTPMQELIDSYAAEGVERTMRYTQRGEAVSPCPPPPPSTWTCPAVRVGEEDRYRAFFQACADGGSPPDDALGACGQTCGDGEVCHYDGSCVPCAVSCADLPDAPVEGVLVDVDDLDEHTDRLVLPEHHLDRPLRVSWDVAGQGESAGESVGTMALRVPYLYRHGSHGVPPSIPERAFNINGYVVDQIVWFFATGGRELVDDPCFEDSSCPFVPWHQAPGADAD